MPNYHQKKRLDIIVEAPLMRTIIGKLDRARVPGYSVLPIIEGRGLDNSWSSDGQIADTTNMVAILCFLDASQADGVMDAVFSVIKDRIGFVTISDVYMVRSNRF